MNHYILRHSLKLRVFFLTVISWSLLSSSHAAEPIPQADLMDMTHVYTCAKKGPQLFGIVYGLRKNDEIAYVIFYDGKKPSPVTTGSVFHQNGGKSFIFSVEQNGKSIEPPDLGQNILVLGDQVTRGHIPKLSSVQLHEYLRKPEAFSLRELLLSGDQKK